MRTNSRTSREKTQDKNMCGLLISTTSNIYTHLDFSSKVASAQAIIGFFPE